MATVGESVIPAGMLIGTAQLASPYGSVRRVYPPKEDEALKMIRFGIENGIIGIDTARTYHQSEQIVGEAISGGDSQMLVEVTTKLDSFREFTPDLPFHHVAERCEDSVMTSIRNIGGDVPLNLLLHRADQINQWNGVIWEKILDIQGRGLLSRVGVSIQSPEEGFMVLQYPGVSLIQMPFNILDDRWIRSGFIDCLKGRPDVEIQCRSLFLQGVLLREKSDWPSIPGLRLMQTLQKMRELVDALHRKDIKDLCIAYVRSYEWVRGCVIGVETFAQLKDNLEYFRYLPLASEEAIFVRNTFSELPDQLVNPALWPKIYE